LLLKEHWKISPELIAAEKGFEQQISGTTGGLVIGDRAFKQIPLSVHHYDLGLAWKEMTGLPFVFAAWVANKILPAEFINAFNTATGTGMQHIDEIVAANPFEAYDLQEYYKKNINYRLDNEKRKGLELFLQKIE
jgi:chorismate dehydratase